MFRYRLPCRQTLSTWVKKGLPEVKRNISEVLKAAASRISCTTDGWTSISMKSYIVITAHFITESWKMQGLTISFKEMAKNHTGANLCSEFVDVVQALGIDDKISCIVSDNASNVVCGNSLIAKALSTNTNKVVPLRCLPHIIHLVATAGFDSLPGPMEKLKAIVHKLRSSNIALALLKTHCATQEETYRRPQNDTPTRWNSTLEMINSMTGMKKSLKKLKTAGNLDQEMTDGDWVLLGQVQTLLKPFKDATELLSGSGYCTLSLAGVIVDHLEFTLKENLYQFQGVGIQAMLDKLEEYKSDIQGQALLPSFFDPRVVLRLSPEERRTAITSIKRELRQVPEQAPKPKETFLDRLDSEGIHVEELAKGFPELQSYLTINGIPLKEDPLLWWAGNHQRFPNLAKLARHYLGMLASSVPSEEAFSTAGDTITKDRNCLKSETIEALMVTQSWKKYQRRFKDAQ
jgi:hypothetical protein